MELFSAIDPIKRAVITPIALFLTIYITNFYVITLNARYQIICKKMSDLYAHHQI